MGKNNTKNTQNIPKHNSKIKLILASSSPRRALILQQIGIPFIQKESSFQEKKVQQINSEKDVKQLVMQNALGKAQDVARNVENGIVVGVDTVVLQGRTVLGKPENNDDALEMLKRLNGTMHVVYSGISVVCKKNGKEETLSSFESSKVFFRKVLLKDLVGYVNTQEPLDKAGAYGIQEKGGFLVKRIEGDYFTVVGFPLPKFFESLEKLNIQIR